MKKILSSIIAVIMLLCTGACTPNLIDTAEVNEYFLNDAVNYTNPDAAEPTMKKIDYKPTVNTQNVNSSDVSLTVYPLDEFNCGEEVKVTVTPTESFTPDSSTKPQVFYYAIVDWGDGTWSYEGPYQNGLYDANIRNASAVLTHKYNTAGNYNIKACYINLNDGVLYGWSDSYAVHIVGTYDYADMLENVQGFATITDSNKNLVNLAVDGSVLIDGDESTFITTPAALNSSDYPSSVGITFDDYYKLDRVEIQFPSSVNLAAFPSNISIDYTTDGGTTWYSIPKYYYLFDYNKEGNRYAPTMKFPNPAGATLSLPMFGLVANGVRVTGHSWLGSKDNRVISVSDIRAYGSKNMLFVTSKGGYHDADLNNMWTIYGTAASEPIVTGDVRATNQSPFRAGWPITTSTEWSDWNGIKFDWTDANSSEYEKNLDSLVYARYGNDGWSNYDGLIYATSGSRMHLGIQNHYSLNAIYIMAVRNYILHGNHQKIYQGGNYVDFLDAVNRVGQTVLNKVQMAMYYMLNAMDGKTGIITIYDPNNDATSDSEDSSNYWDTHVCFGYKSAYENALFYASLNAMSDIEFYLGNNIKAQYYTELAAKCKTQYTKLFWDSSKGRFICSINARNERIDFGFGIVNYLAVTYGLASNYQAQQIYSWMDGQRIVNGDTTTGANIYGMYKYSAVTNTVDVASVIAPSGSRKYYWFDHGGALKCYGDNFGAYGHQMQNGGTIFYTSYYDIMGRIAGVGPDNGYSRFSSIMTEFHKDSLRRNHYKKFTDDTGSSAYGEYIEGVIGEFPESGLVPLVFLNGFMGVNTGCANGYYGLIIDPKLPSDYEYAGVNEYHFGNRVYSIVVSKKVNDPQVSKDGNTYKLTLPASDRYLITLDNRLIKLN